jgi:bacteriocin biosynthesis cyclodehydratase domain-containing protein
MSVPSTPSEESAVSPSSAVSDDLGGSHPRLKETVEVFDASDGTIYLIPATGGRDFQLPQAGAADRALLDTLDGTRSAEVIATTLAGQFPETSPEEVLASITGLAEAGLITDARAQTSHLSQAETKRYNRQLVYFTDLLPYTAAADEPQHHLATATVAILGLGGVGSWIALALAGIGVGHLVIADGDTVETNNLNRQILYAESDLGQQKAHAARRRLTEFNNQITITASQEFLNSPQQLREVISEADFVVEAADTPVHDFGRWVDAACRAQGIPHIVMSQIPPLVRVGPTFVPGRTGCLACYEQPAHEEFPLFDELVDYRRHRGAVAAALAPGCALIAGVVSSEVLHHLTGLATPATLGTALTIDMHTLATTREAVEHAPECPHCAADSP